MPKPIIFTTSNCAWCRRAKRYFRENRVPFKEIHVEKDPQAARDLVKKTGQTGVPIIKIGGSWIVGFDRDSCSGTPSDPASAEDPVSPGRLA
jgi:glutaredoxin 3